METTSQDFLIGLLLPIVVFGLFIFSVALRIKNAWKKLHEPSQYKGKLILGKVDIVFSSIFLASSFVILVVFLLNYGR